MKKWLSAIGVTASGLLGATAIAQVPTQVPQSLSHTQMRWRLKEDNYYVAQPAAILAKIQAQAKQHNIADAARAHIRDQAVIDKMVASEAAGLAIVNSGMPFEFTTEVTINRFGGITSVAAVRPDRGSPSSVHYADYLMPNTHVALEHAVSPPEMGVDDPEIWATTGPAAAYASPMIGSLDIDPSELCMLGGLPARGLYGARWIQRGGNPSTVDAEVTAGNNSPYTASLETAGEFGNSLVLSKRSGVFNRGAGTRWSAIVSAAGYHRVGDGWLPRTINSRFVTPRWTRVRTWTLTSAGPGLPVNVPIAAGEMVTDHRLIPGTLNVRDIDSPTKEEIGLTVQYPWPGHLISINELMRERSRQMDQASLGSSRLTWTLLLPAIVALCGALIIWPVRRRQIGRVPPGQ